MTATLPLQDAASFVPDLSDNTASLCSLTAKADLVLFLREWWTEELPNMSAHQAQLLLLTAISSHARNFLVKTFHSLKYSFSIFVYDDGNAPSQCFADVVAFLLRHGLQQRKGMSIGRKTNSSPWVFILQQIPKLIEYS